MKKITALIFVLTAAGWAFYLYGYGKTADAKARADTAYARDPQLTLWLERLQTLNTDLRRQLDILEHAEKKRTAAGEAEAPPTLKKPIRDPFSSLP